jgi:hypothetical protein
MNKPKTQLMANPMVESTVESVIATLKHINVDGETMEYILEQVGMTDQMLRQLVLTSSLEQVEYLVEEKKDLEIQK